MNAIIYKRGWQALFKEINKKSDHEKGKLFEELTYLVLTTKPQYTSILKNVWIHGKGMPGSIQKKLNLPNSDEGIDLIAETFSGEFWAIQCKFKGNNQSPTRRELSTFIQLAHGHCKHISMALLVHTGERGVRKKHLLGDKYSEIGLEFWLELTDEDWLRIWSKKVKKPIKPQKRLPKPHQKKAIGDAHKHFIKDAQSRGRLIMPCGTGKSLTAFWIANKLNAQSIVVAVPSLNLIKQSLEDWTREFEAIGKKHRPSWKIICSDKSVSSIENDEFVTDVASLGVPTTDLKDLTKFLKASTKGKKIVFTTYQSSQILAEAARKTKFRFDFAILDEAHKTVGEKSKSFATLLSDRNIHIKKRMFMTATERVLKGKNDDVHSMDDVSVYGERFYQLTFKAAIQSKPNIISDYKILTIAVSDSQIRELVQKNRLLSDKKGKINDQEAQSLAAAIALRQATKQYGIKHAISFHKSIKSAEKFTALNQDLNELKGNKVSLTSFHISSKKSTGERSRLIEDFKSESLALMTNARCLTEGVNIPAIDCVLFADPKQSVVDIVQAAGRALRVNKGKKFGYIMLPIVVPDKTSIEKFTESTPFKQVARIITALSTQDERIVEELKFKAEGKRRQSDGKSIIANTISAFGIDHPAFATGIQSKIWEKVGKANWQSFEAARKYVRMLQLPSTDEWFKFARSGRKPFDIPTFPNELYRSDWKGFGDFLGTGFIPTKYREYLPFEQARDYIRKQQIKSIAEWKVYCKKNKPENIPAAPDQKYKNEGWISWGDFLGHNYVSSINSTIKSFKKVRNLARRLKLNSAKQWFTHWKKYPRDKTCVPLNPQTTFRQYWKGWGDFLGTGNESLVTKKYLSFKDARNFVLMRNIKSVAEWKALIKSNKIPGSIPRLPHLVYRDSGWKSWGHFLGTNKVAPQNMVYRPYRVCKLFVRGLKLKSRTEWEIFVKSGAKPDDIPAAPHMCKQYKNEGWISWGDFLGTGRTSPSNINYKRFHDARKFVRSLKLKSYTDWTTYCKSGKKPDDIPYHPERKYIKEWKGYEDFIGYKYSTDFVTYDVAKKYVGKLKLNSRGWRNFVSSGKKPKEIPSNPDKTYQDKGWKGWADFLGKTNG